MGFPSEDRGGIWHFFGRSAAPGCRHTPRLDRYSTFLGPLTAVAATGQADPWHRHVCDCYATPWQHAFLAACDHRVARPGGRQAGTGRAGSLRGLRRQGDSAAVRGAARDGGRPEGDRHGAERRHDRGRGRADASATPPGWRAKGVSWRSRRSTARPRRRRCASRPRPAGTAYRSYSEPGGIRDELVATAARFPKLAKVVTIGRTQQGKPILAVKVTKNARNVRDGRAPGDRSTSAPSTPASGSRSR